jgi:hypothetical protein
VTKCIGNKAVVADVLALKMVKLSKLPFHISHMDLPRKTARLCFGLWTFMSTGNLVSVTSCPVCKLFVTWDITANHTIGIHRLKALLIPLAFSEFLEILTQSPTSTKKRLAK